MPCVCRFFGIVIYIYCDDHAPPHFHARYSGTEAPSTAFLVALAPRAGLVTSRQTFVRRGHLGWTASEPPHFSRNGTPPRRWASSGAKPR